MTAVSPEYTRSWSLEAISAISAYQEAATGAGVTVAVIDSGVDLSLPELLGRISPQSTDIVPGRNALDRGSEHGTRVATVIAANYNGTGTMGIAYEATILAIRADNSPGTCPSDGCSFADRDLTAAIDFAVANGARIINMSLGGPTPDGAAFEAAMQRAVAAGIVFTFSAGNDATANPEWPARYAADPRFQGYVMAVGASQPNGNLATFSARAGVAADWFVVAPGADIITHCDASNACWRVSGTSFSSPAAAASVALLLQSFPMLSGREAVEILFRTAKDQGEAGVDPVWGHGLIDLKSAFAPIGTLSVPTPGGGAFAPVSPPGSSLGAAFGDAVLQSSQLKTFGRDDYRRIYPVDAAKILPQGEAALLGRQMPATRQTTVAVTGPAGSRWALQAEQSLFGGYDLPPVLQSFIEGRPPASVAVRAKLGRLELTAWKGEGGALAPGAEWRDAFQALAAPDEAVSAVYGLGNGWSLAAEQGRSERTDIFELREVDASDYVAGGLRYQGERATANLSIGSLKERRGPLGADIAPSSPFAMPAETSFIAASFGRQVRPWLTLRMEGGLGRTRIEESQFFSTDDTVSSQWRVGLYGACWRLNLICESLLLEIEQPLRVEEGNFRALLADYPAHWKDPTTFSYRQLSTSPSGRELDFRLTLSQGSERWGRWRLRGVMALQDGHRADADAAFGAAVDWRLTF